MSRATLDALAGQWTPHALAAELERVLGGAARTFTPQQSAALDSDERFPAGICRDLDALGLPRWFVPEAHGGALRDSEDLAQLIRVLSRRDFTVALAHVKTYLGAVSVWVAGSDRQAAALAARVSAGEVVSLALTEHEHGSDLLAGDLSATPLASGGWRLDGEKWLINNATRAGMVCVLARTNPAGGARGFSLLLVDKAALTPGSWRALPAVPTHGVRGADISGIAFTGARVAADALIGAEGEGLETILKGFQITRTLCSAMSLGMTDHALRLAMRFAGAHRLYGRPLAELPQAARTLTESYVDMLAMEAVSLVGVRSIHALPAEQSVASAVVKYLVPSLGDGVIDGLRGVLGARAMLVADHEEGAFQKLDRDHRIVGIFDGSTAVNLNLLVNQFPALVRGYRAGHTDEPGLAAAVTSDGPPPPLQPQRLALYSRSGSSVVQSLPAAVAGIQELAARHDIPDALADRCARLRDVADSVHAELSTVRPSPRGVTEETFVLARRYAVLYAAAASAHLFLAGFGARAADPLWQRGAWLDAVLTRLLRRLTGEPDLDDEDGPAVDALLPVLRAQHDRGQLFSLYPCELAKEEP
ncbi:acyl-CoA dehydrogenase family protein [Micromonospora sp. NPDC048843]|uniref:acyl-CoA dehydrogenase family protein n=1 Tax=Micromonospora sp. NPDC048843 TaxID=3155389 RepID=UPI0033C5FC50